MWWWKHFLSFRAAIKNHPTSYFFAASLPFVYSVSLPLKSMWIAPLKFPRGPVDMLSPRWGRPVHTQVPWWCTMCLRCFRPRPLSLKSVTRCCDVSTRALAIAIPGNPERKERERYWVCIYFHLSPPEDFSFIKGGLLRWPPVVATLLSWYCKPVTICVILIFIGFMNCTSFKVVKKYSKAAELRM